ncbi:MAG: hypothetical protein PHH82_02010 [Candidatus ainarchaeum sp.]|nr:hypothetical protein [Candidatus ainarchaeum sp.]
MKELFYVSLFFNKGEKEYRKLMFKSLIIGYFVFLAFLFPFFSVYALVYSAFFSLCIYAFCLVLPYLLKKHFIGNLEKDLPYFLMDLDISLFLNSDFLDSIKVNSRKYKTINIVFEKLLFNYLKGSNLQDSFFKIAERINSVPLKRSLSQIMVLYESGYKDNILTTLAQELLNKQKLEAKGYSSKLVMYSLFFIAATAILPSLYLMFVTVGSTIIQVNITPTQLMILFFAVFPLIDIVYISFVVYQMPYHLKEGR